MNNSHQKQRVALLSMGASGVMSIVKIVAALLTGSLGVLSEALHSVIDFGATVVTLFAVRWADQPADDEHHYGHAKIESIAALLETALLFVTAIFIAYHAVMRLYEGHEPVTVQWWVIALLVVSIIVDLNRSRALNRTAKVTSSEALAADAAHFQSDMWSSGAVLLGLAGVWAGLSWADSVAALGVCGFIIHIGWNLGGKTLNTLLDAAPPGLTEAVRRAALSQNGVLAVSQLRVRPAGATLFVDLGLDVPRTLPLTEATTLRANLERDIKTLHANADVNIVTNLVALDSETAIQKVSVIAAARGLAVHHLLVQQLGDKLAVSFDFEVDGKTSLLVAHEMATALEADIRTGLGGNVEVESHIEPQPMTLFYGREASAKVKAQVSATLIRLAKQEKSLKDLHNIRIRETEAGLFVHYHCRFSSKMNVEGVHAAVDRLETRFMQAQPKVRRVVAHAEPLGRAKHEL
ncbi:MAG: cation diffusion facilitator family transporter [Aestuariivirga sp.]